MGVFYSRAAWGARRAKGFTPVAPDKRKEFIVHYTTGEELGREDCAEWVRQIQNYHMDTQKWSDIGYNFLVCKHGDIFEGRGWNIVGAHCPNHNTQGIGVAYLGNDSPDSTDATPDALRAIQSLWVEAYVSRGTPTLSRHGHRDFKATACPGQELYDWVKQGMPLEPLPAPQPEIPDYKEEDMKSTLVTIGPLDTNGNGWKDWNPGLGRDPVIVGLVKQGPHPPSNGYWPDQANADVAAQPRAGAVVVTVRGGKPGTSLSVFVSVV